MLKGVRAVLENRMASTCTRGKDALAVHVRSSVIAMLTVLQLSLSRSKSVKIRFARKETAIRARYVRDVCAGNAMTLQFRDT